MKNNIRNRVAFTFLAVLPLAGFVGCQVSQNGQVLPSPGYLADDVSYFPTGPEFKLSKEAAALRAARAQEKQSR